MSFGQQQQFGNQALFDQYPIGTLLAIGMDSAFWYGSFGGVQDSATTGTAATFGTTTNGGGVAVLTQAQLFSNIGTPIDGIRPVVRIPITQITFVSL